MALRCFGIFTAVLVAIGGAYYQLSLKSTLEKAGLWRQITNIGAENCRQVKGLEACEKIVLHQPSGILYLACSSIENRVNWTPALDHLNASAVLPDKDHIAAYDPSSNKITHMKIKGMADTRLSVHGMDVVPSSKSPAELWFYVVNHRVPRDGKDPVEVGADSVVEIFKGGVGGSVLEWVKTIESEHLHTPNDVAGDPDGQAFYFTNDNYAKRGWKRQLQIPLGLQQTSVGYCHVDEGCRIVAPKLPAANGITRAHDGTYYVASVLAKVIALERQTDNSMILGDIIEADRGLDNIQVAENGDIYAAGFPDGFTIQSYFVDPFGVVCPSSAVRISKNTDRSSFFGEKYKLEVIFQDNGTFTPPATSAVYDSRRERLFLHGILSTHLTVCEA